MKPPEPHEPVRLGVAGVGDLPARVDRADAGTLVLTVLAGPRLELGRQQQRTASLEFTGPRGLGRIDGTLRPEAPPRDGDALRFDFAGDVEVRQRRDFARVDAVVTVAVVPPRPGSSPVPALTTNTLDVSGNGLLISAGGELPLGARVDLQLALPDGAAPLALSARVVRHDRERAAVAIDAIAPADRERIVRYVFARQRVGRALTRDG